MNHMDKRQQRPKTRPTDKPQRSAIPEIASHVGTSWAEREEILEHLICQRECRCDERVRALRREAKALTARLSAISRAMLREELDCFREVAALHENLLHERSENRGQAAQARRR
jgi:hypothetical protein